jgi:hypothetical protein
MFKHTIVNFIVGSMLADIGFGERDVNISSYVSKTFALMSNYDSLYLSAIPVLLN